MLKKVLSSFLPIGLLIKAISGITDYYEILSDFGKGFLDGMAMVFIIVGVIFFIGMFFNKRKQIV